MKMKRPFGRRPRLTALGRGAVSSRKFPRAENATRKKSWGRSVCPPAILCGIIQQNISTPQPICRSSTETCCRISTVAGIGCISFRTTPLITRSQKSWSSLPSTPARWKRLRFPLFSGIQCDRAALALHPEAKHAQPLLRSTGGVMPGTVHDVHRHAKASRKNSRTLGAIFLESVCSFIYTRTCSPQH